MKKKAYNHKIPTKKKRLQNNILEAASGLNEVSRKECQRQIDELEEELLKYKQLLAFLNAASAKNIKIDNDIMDRIQFNTMDEISQYLEQGSEMDYWKKVVKAYKLFEGLI